MAIFTTGKRIHLPYLFIDIIFPLISSTQYWSPQTASYSRRCLFLVCGAIILFNLCPLPVGHSTVPSSARGNHVGTGRTLLSYAYAEGLGNGGEIDLHNLRFFMKVALKGALPGTMDTSERVDYVIVVSGDICTPCRDTLPGILKKSSRRNWVKVLYKKNFGMDFAAYNTSLTWVQRQHRLTTYDYFVFINSSLRGPFMPKWTPPGFHFTDALVLMFQLDERVKLAGSYITCLPKERESMPGPIIESLFFAVDKESLQWLIDDGIFVPHKMKYLTALSSEYSLFRSVSSRGGFLEGLSTRYAKGIDWQQTKHHRCNDNRHSSRRGLLDGEISPNPFEHVFLKTSWCVRAAETSVLSDWFIKLSEGLPGTAGHFDANGYERGISIEGTSGKNGTLPRDVPVDGCRSGDISSLRIKS